MYDTFSGTPAVYSVITIKFKSDGETFSATRPSGIINQMVEAQRFTELSREEHMAELAKRAKNLAGEECEDSTSEWKLLRTLEQAGFLEIFFDLSGETK